VGNGSPSRHVHAASDHFSGPGATRRLHGGALHFAHARHRDLPACVPVPVPVSTPPCPAAAPSLSPELAAWIVLRGLYFVWWGPSSLQPPPTLLRLSRFPRTCDGTDVLYQAPRWAPNVPSG